ncbi:hypothetical protein BAE44_0019518, partial [Dichanthelium oligosanthes]
LRNYVYPLRKYLYRHEIENCEYVYMKRKTDAPSLRICSSRIRSSNTGACMAKGPHRPYTVDDFPRFSCSYEEQNHVLYTKPDIELRGPSPIRLYPAFKYGKHVFGSDHNLGDKSERHRTFVTKARVISMISRALIEFELHVLTEGRPDEDEPKGGTDNMFCNSARIDVEVLRLGAIASGINLKVYAKTSGFSDVIRLFQDAAPRPGVVISFVVAVETHNYLDLYIEGSRRDNDPVLGRMEKKPVPRSWSNCSFGSGYHCMDREIAELGEFAVVSVNVNWKSYRKKESLDYLYWSS